MAERNQDVFGSHGRCHVPNNHSKYRTSSRRFRSGSPIYLQRYHPGPGIEPADSLAGEALHIRVLGGEKRLDCSDRVIRRDPRQHHLPFRGLEPGRRLGGQVGDLDHVDPLRQGRAQPVPDDIRIKLCREGDLKELGLAGSPGGGAARVRNLRMRRETG